MKSENLLKLEMYGEKIYLQGNVWGKSLPSRPRCIQFIIY